MTSAYLPPRLWRTSDKALAHSRRQASAWVPPLVFLLGKMIVDRVTVIRCLVHVGEWRILIQALAHLFPRLMRGRTRHLDVHGISILAAADGNGSAGGLDRLLGEFDVRDLL